MAKQRGVPSLAWALKEAESLGLRVELKAGEAIVRGKGWATRANVRKKDCPRKLLGHLRRELERQERALWEEGMREASKKQPAGERCGACEAPHEGQRACDVFTDEQLMSAIEWCEACGWPTFEDE